jgi:hypothetical protein
LHQPTVQHRHLTHQQFTLAAIDDVIARGKRRDWAELRQAELAERAVLEEALRACEAHAADPYAQRYHFWKQYADLEERSTSSNTRTWIRAGTTGGPSRPRALIMPP